MNIQPKNEIAKKLLEKLAVIGLEPLPGYHAPSRFCIAVHTDNCADAVRLGMYLGDCVGEVSFSTHPAMRGQRVVFCDALVSL